MCRAYSHDPVLNALSCPIKSVWLSPPANVLPLSAIRLMEADIVVFGPGDLYTSIIPNLLVGGVADILRSPLFRGRIVYVSNQFTKPGETDGYRASDFVHTIQSYLGRQVNDVIVNTGEFTPDVIKRYSEKHAHPVINDLSEPYSGTRFHARDFTLHDMPGRHNADAVADVIEKIAYGMKKTL